LDFVLKPDAEVRDVLERLILVELLDISRR